ncbi:hypothetical protein KKG48_00270, partial [Patescibacteria group bacterium]|nr:hypothetical protein [Patescibacteria group bacterium]
MKIKFLRNVLIITFLFLSTFSFSSADIENDDLINIYLFGRENCNFCQLEETFLNSLLSQRNDFNLVYLDVSEIDAKQKFNQITELYDLPKATPITLVGNSVFQGFNSDDTTGQMIISVLNNFQKGGEIFTLDDYLKNDVTIASQQNAVCEDEET